MPSVISAELKNRRRDQRFAGEPIQFEVDGALYTVTDWSLGGFQIHSYYGQVLPGTILPVAFVITIGNHTIRHEAECQVVRVDPTRGRLSARFTQLPSDAVSSLEGLQTGRYRRLKLRKFPSKK